MIADYTQPALLGREHELRAIGLAFDRSSTGGCALLVVGEPGVGKSALLSAAIEDGRRRGLIVLSVRGS